jgi:hypothetical protein
MTEAEMIAWIDNADLEALKAHCERIAKDEREEHDR